MLEISRQVVAVQKNTLEIHDNFVSIVQSNKAINSRVLNKQLYTFILFNDFFPSCISYLQFITNIPL